MFLADSRSSQSRLVRISLNQDRPKLKSKLGLNLINAGNLKTEIPQLIMDSVHQKDLSNTGIDMPWTKLPFRRGEFIARRVVCPDTKRVCCDPRFNTSS